MAREFDEYLIREEYPPASDEFPAPDEEAEFRPPAPEAEYPAPPGTDFENPDPETEFTPPSSGGTALSAPRERRFLKRLLYAAAGTALVWAIASHSPAALTPPPAFPAGGDAPSGAETPLNTPGAVSSLVPPQQTAEAAATPLPESGPEDAVPGPPELRAVFFSFSHEHHGRLYLANTAALRSVELSVRDSLLDRQVYAHRLSGEEIAGGVFELPMLSTGEYYMENMDAVDAAGGWPQFEMRVEARYDDGGREETLVYVLEPEFELGIGVSYMRPDYTWSEVVPPDSFVVSPWEETDEIRYVIADPDAVTDPTTFSVDLSCAGRHAAPEDYETVTEREDYTLLTADGGEIPQTSYTKKLVLRRPDWMPKSGTLHVSIVQRLASTGELWVREYDLPYPSDYE